MDLKQTKLAYLILLDELRLQGDSIQTRDPPSLTPTSAMYDLDARALESPSERLQNSFVEANHQLISWLKI